MTNDTNKLPPPETLPCTPHEVLVVGGGAAGLLAARVLAAAGTRVTVFDTMPSVGRKFLLAGRGGLNLTHSEPLADFLGHYGDRRDPLAPLVEAPTLLVHGANDPLMPLPAAEALAALIPDARLAIFADCAHAPFISRPEEFLERVQAFLNE